MKDELGGKIMTDFMALRPKLYSYKKLDGSEDKKCKGIKKYVVKKILTFEDYKTCLFNDSTEYRSQLMFRSAKHEVHTIKVNDRKNDLILIMTPEKQDKTLELSKHWSVDSTPARNEVIMKRTYPVKSVKCDKICSNY